MVNLLTFMKLGTYVFPMWVIYQIRLAQLAAQPKEEEEEHQGGGEGGAGGH